ncbi:hypothetical protein ACFQ6N_17285 [Kitasatospora sp. NPDC056446]|uniref:hypothetical protein n=1 Tax=Kitasatospora sp. NPDC056446 TaxID=3345819 RepID=UPI00369E4E31
MKVTWGSRMGWLGWLGPLAVQPSSWVALCLIAALAAVGSCLAEWQRRVTLSALVRDAPAGTVVVQGEGGGGPTMSVRIGSPSEVERNGESG